MIEGQDVSIPRANTRILRIPVTRGGEPYDLSLPSAHRLFYTVTNGNTVVLTKDSNDATPTIGLMSGTPTTVEVTLSNADTDIEPLTYQHELEVWHPDGSVWDAMHGSLTISASIKHPATVV